jgi:hypothetical protein
MASDRTAVWLSLEINRAKSEARWSADFAICKRWRPRNRQVALLSLCVCALKRDRAVAMILYHFVVAVPHDRKFTENSAK